MARDLNVLSEESTEQVIKFSPKQQLSISTDEAGQAVIAKIRKAAELSHETCDRAMALAHKLAMQIRGAEDRINRLEREVAVFRDRAARAEGWLQTIHQEIEEKLIAPRSTSDTEQNLVSSSDPNNSETMPLPAA
jgi:RES domain-containing protein